MSDLIPEFAVGWGVLALIDAGLAKIKNRSGIAWFIFSVFFGPLATLAIVLLRKIEPFDPEMPVDFPDHQDQ